MRKLFLFSTFVALALISTNSYAQTDNELKKIQEKAAKALKNAQKIVAKTPALKTSDDSLAYTFGVAQSNGLRNYIIQMGVDTAYIDQFVQGVMERASLDKDDKARFAYFQGLQIGGQVQQMATDISKNISTADSQTTIDPNIVATGVMQGMLGNSSKKVEAAGEEFRAYMTALQQKQEEQRKQEAERQNAQTIAEGKTFLEANKTKPGVVTTPSGLQYKVLKLGDGPLPNANQRVKVHYEGHLINGTEFDSSYKRGEPATFGVKDVIKGWTEALCLMPVGSKYELYIPYNLAYGERAAGAIPPCSTLIFTVELLGIE